MARKLPYKIADKNAIDALLEEIKAKPETFLEFFEETDGGFVLATEGLPPAAQASLEAARKDAKDAQTKLKAYKLPDGNYLDPKRVTDLEAQLSSVEDARRVQSGELEKVITERTEKMRRALSDENEALRANVNKLTGELDTTTKKLNHTIVEGELTRLAATVPGFKSSALTDMLLRGEHMWRYQDGKILAFNAADDVVRGTNGVDPLTPQEWLTKVLPKEASHFFEASNGGGSGGGHKGGSGGGGFISRDDKKAFNENLDDIAKGKKKVAPEA